MVICQGFASERLAQAEFIIMDQLFRGKGSYVSRDYLVATIWRNARNEPSDGAKQVTVYMWRIRQKMKRLGTKDRIVTAYAHGYRLEQAPL